MATRQMPDKGLLKDNSDRARGNGDDLNRGSGTRSGPVAEGKMREKTLAMKFAEVFFEGTLKDAINYMINDVAIPQIKNAVLKGLEVIFYGGATSSNRNGRGSGEIPYNSYWVGRDGSRRSSSSNNQRNDGGTASELSKLKKSFDPKLIVVEDRGEAQRVLSELRGDCEEFGQVGVDRLFELCGIMSDWTSTKYGWVKGDLDNARVRPCGNGWWFDLPDPIVID